MTPLVVSGDGMAWAWTALEITAVRDVPAEQALPDQATYLDRLLAAHPGEVFALRWLRSEPGRLRLWLLARTSAAVPETRTTKLGKFRFTVPKP